MKNGTEAGKPMSGYQVGYIVGSLSTKSINRTLAKALINRPLIVLLDEPTASLDPETADWVRTFLARYADEAGATFLIASHNMFEVERLCERVVFLSQGRVVADGRPAEITERFGQDDLEEVFLHLASERQDSEQTVGLRP